MNGRGRGVRILLISAGLAVVGGLAYLSFPESERPVWLYDARTFSEDAARSIQSALATEDIVVYEDGKGRLGVRSSSWAKALAVLRKKNVEPPTIAEIEKDYQTPNLWETRDQREQRLHWGLERKLEVMIEQLDDVRSADVTIHREQTRWGMRPEWKLSGFVFVEPGSGRELSSRSVQAIQSYLVSNCSGLRPDAVGISDRSGKFYLVAGEPGAGLRSHGMARAEELRESILQRLGYIKGVVVLVQMEEIASEPVAPPTISTNVRAPLKSGSPTETVANQPLELEADRVPAASEAPGARPSPTPPSPRAKVLIQVPRSYYLDAFWEHAPNRQPAPEDLVPYSIRTEAAIRNVVTQLVPINEMGTIGIDTIPDGRIQARVVATPGSAGFEGSLRQLPDWLPGAAVGTGAGLLVATIAGFGLRAARGPKSASRSTVGRGGVTFDPPGTAVSGPSERVRELVRADPEAAAGVLRRWIGQKGETS